jgi:hypothetical protein
MMNTLSRALSVTLSEKLYDRLSSESARLAVPLEWLVASLLVEMASDDAPTITSLSNVAPL